MAAMELGRGMSSGTAQRIFGITFVVTNYFVRSKDISSVDIRERKRKCQRGRTVPFRLPSCVSENELKIATSSHTFIVVEVGETARKYFESYDLKLRLLQTQHGP